MIETFNEQISYLCWMITAFSQEELFEPGFLHPVRVAGVEVDPRQHGGAIHVVPHEDPPLETRDGTPGRH